jgi:hypothetical protein
MNGVSHVGKNLFDVPRANIGFALMPEKFGVWA